MNTIAWVLPLSGVFISAEAIAQGPVDVLELADRSLLVSDDLQGKLYRITYRE